MTFGSVARLAYGLGALLAPGWMSGRLTPEIHDAPDPRMNLRGFGAEHVTIAVFTLAGTRNRSRLDVRTAIALKLRAISSTPARRPSS
ncbi:MAG: hypothetical protein NVSMB25_14150 [Thermoleophilaceae bacterium]